MRKWPTFPHREGTYSKQAHADFPEEAIYEREAGREGFFGPASHFHHQHAPTAGLNGKVSSSHVPLISITLNPRINKYRGQRQPCLRIANVRFAFGRSLKTCQVLFATVMAMSFCSYTKETPTFTAIMGISR
ncbi:homogentisate 1,2-dioxygenase [Vibrio maritimus]|uniref:Homogentisate 1,2-dioxygenase n=1 Tax=Vibrio maritimus TaxID=990268 RepID=A0A090RMX7_9VIBR|nr:homogentisate 1,2-dioxygenase [Vibrio maritimus]